MTAHRVERIGDATDAERLVDETIAYWRVRGITTQMVWAALKGRPELGTIVSWNDVRRVMLRWEVRRRAKTDMAEAVLAA